jgi:hypothetical protein
MKRPLAIFLLLVALLSGALTASCGLKINMPTLGSVEQRAAAAATIREIARLGTSSSTTVIG